MKILLISIGTRGDMEPFLAIGTMLREKDHEVICAFPEQFGDLAESTELPFASLGRQFINMLESPPGRAAFGGSGSGLRKMLAYIRLARLSTAANKELLQRQYEITESEKPDRIVYNGKCMYPIILEIDHPGRNILVSPVPYLHYVREHTHLAFNSNFGPFLNRMTYRLANFGMITTVKISLKWLKISRKISRKQIRKTLQTGRVVYTISPTLFPRPDYWPETIGVAGYHAGPKKMDWKPDKALNSFLEKHSKFIFITLGSMTNPNPVKKTAILVDILERHNIPALINAASGGLVGPEKYNRELIFFIDSIPYHWILPKAYALIHHGGSGTTHLGLRYGCAAMIIPHILDQFVWDRINAEKGSGPRGIRINRLSVKKLEPRLLDLWNNTAYKKKAEEISVRMQEEDLRNELISTITN